MPNIYETLDKHYIVYEGKKIRVIVDNNDALSFNIKDTLLALGYKDYRDVIKTRIQRKYIKQKKDIDYDQSPGQPRTLYISESGLYRLISRSNLPAAVRFTDWVFDELIIQVRKYGKYKIKIGYETEAEKLFKKINILERQNKIMREDRRKEKFPDGGIVYAIDYSDEYEETYRIGRTTNMKKRKKIYDTHTHHKRPVVLIARTHNPHQLEACIRAGLHEYRYMDNKDMYNCSRDKVREVFRRCKKIVCPIAESINANQIGGTRYTVIDEMLRSAYLKRSQLKYKINKLNQYLGLKQ